ncbi:16S rRNA processing protein RimM [Corynebacterium phocae]|uniref:Ribosome maturation factor RimM n=1 Tax=Corynebacterium phocae TaxID=161895 RepID=A0A1L7D6C7_9CORY|nr:ribosome maturation factor RimM [Corynebacterium phocae]APT93670.1 16S rRNA processing protein RimM [Corynebacterium phocae]KAA8725336.1 ribosome maturation factor RimM [Corynebacterium phocae]
MELMIGRVVKPHGVKGEVVVESTTEAPEVRFAVGEKLLGRQTNQTSKEIPLTVKSVRPHKGRLLIFFTEVPDCNTAETLRGLKFYAPPLEDPEDDGFYDHELEGLRVIHDGQEIGEVTAITHGPTQSLLEVTLSSGAEALVPFVEEIVPGVDLEAGTVTITPPEGLLEL